MAVYRLGYDMNVPGERRAKIAEYIREQFAFCRIAETDYLIQSQDASANNLWETHFAKYFDTTDHALLIQCQRNYQGLLTEEQWSWIRNAEY